MIPFCVFPQINTLETDFVQKDIPEVTIPGTELRTLRSEIIGQNFNLYIKLPWSYTRSDTIYPVLYSLDANRSFPLFANISTVLEFPPNDFPETIVVGIGYQIKGMEDWGAWRTRDLTPVTDVETEENWEKILTNLSGRSDIVVQTGGASKFLDFIRLELIPFIESNYHVSSTDRTLAGYSFGGLFTLYALFHHPETFSRYFCGSPSIYYGKAILFEYEKQYASIHSDLKARVFMSVGGLENLSMINNMTKMDSLLRSRNYPGFQIESHIFDGEDHQSCYPGAVVRALKVLYK
jgi:hypothetical protein